MSALIAFCIGVGVGLLIAAHLNQWGCPPE